MLVQFIYQLLFLAHTRRKVPLSPADEEEEQATTEEAAAMAAKRSEMVRRMAET